MAVTPFMQKVAVAIPAGILIILIIDLLETRHHVIAISLIALIVGISIGVAYDLGAKESQFPTKR